MSISMNTRKSRIGYGLLYTSPLLCLLWATQASGTITATRLIGELDPYTPPEECEEEGAEDCTDDGNEGAAASSEEGI